MPHQPTLDETTRLDGDARLTRPPQNNAHDLPPPERGVHLALSLHETARMGGGRAHLPPITPTGSRPATPTPQDTRPVTRDWTRGAPADAATAPVADPAAELTDRIAPEPIFEAPRPLSQIADEPPAAAADDDTIPPGVRTTFLDDEAARPLWWRRRSFLVPAAAVAVLAGAYGADLLLSSGDIPRNTVVAGVDIGGLSPTAATHALQQRLAPRIAADRAVVAADLKGKLSPPAAGLGLDVRRTVDAADDQPLNPWTRVVSLFADRNIAPVIATDSAMLSAQLDSLAEQVDQAPVEATISIAGTTPHLVAPADGRALDRGATARVITAALQSGDGGTIRLPVRVAHPHVNAASAQQVLDQTVTPALSAPVDIVGQDGAHHTQVPVSAIAASLTFTPQKNGSLAVTVDPAKLQAAMGAQFTAFGSPAKDARFEVTGDSIHVVPSVDGTGIDPAVLAQQLMPVLKQTGQRTITAQLGPVKAAFTTEQAQALGITEKVSSFTTHFTMTPSATNIRVVAEKVNGALVKPGETFSLNDFTGPRGTAQGYIPANVIEGGHLSKAVGGGISQFATTMFNAEFFAGVQDIHHKTHSFYISRYPAGREATVFDGLIDLVWKNDSSTGIYVQTQWVSGGSLTVTFWGTKHYDIESVSGDRTNVTDPSVQDKPDDGTCIPQSGAQGFDITVTRLFHDLKSGAVVKKETFRTHYIPEAIIHCLPVATPPPGPTG